MLNKKYLHIDNLIKNFGEFSALKGISLDINEGEFVCFLGPSGCGKTTLLRAIAGLELPTSGQISQNNRDITLLPPEQRDFGIVFQSYALFPNLTVADNIAFGLINRGLKKAAALEKVSEWLSLVDLDGYDDQFPAQLSGGQQQRVALCRALALSPGLLLLDEPLSALDAKVRTHLRHEICQLQRQLGITTIMVTHDQEEALTMADRIVVMNHGVVEQVGTPEEIYNHPASEFVAKFVGTMNFLPARVMEKDTLKIDDFTFKSPRMVDSESVNLALRPEEIRLAEDGQSGLNATVNALEFMGAYVRLECQPDSTLPVVQVDISSERAKKGLPAKGERCRLMWDAKHAHVFEGAPA
ncbi:putative 2-aminoethylphosphonate ABC transporter ATP-binding protein [Photobacterium minamisatsumaniensis]|uniref:putative 2-aminoethylphosphonate ABC transporter ATP-binding protein n=1 Tax=Photobacterium minamisatsumaniensis TaxID=2910233 RepID=UPI003D144B3B